MILMDRGFGRELLAHWDTERRISRATRPIWVKCGMSWLHATLDQASRSGRLHALGISQSGREMTMARWLALDKD